MGLLKILFNVGAATLALFFLQPLMNAVRVSTLALSLDSLVLNFVLMLLLPLIWLMFIFLAILEIKRGVENINDGI